MESPKHLESLLDKTPLAIERIKQAWPGLSTSDRAYIISVLLTTRHQGRTPLEWTHHQNQLLDLALADDNAYVRYLAAKNVDEPFRLNDDDETPQYLEEKARFEKIKSDPVALVRSASKEQGLKWMVQELDDAGFFWKRPQIERLALVNGVKESGEKLAELLRYATKDLLPGNLVTLEDMLDVLLQYLGGKTIAERVADAEDDARRSCDGFSEYCTGESVKALWEVIPDIPKKLSYVLIECLPEEAGLNLNIPPQVIDSLDEGQLESLLYRNDVSLEDLRRKLYKESTNDSIRQAAMTSERFDLLDSDISELAYDPGESAESGKKKVDALAMLAENCRGATLVQMKAICDLIRNAPTDFHSGFFGPWEAISRGEDLQTYRAKRLSPSALQYEVFDLRLFSLAKHLSPMKNDETPIGLPEKLAKHRGIVVPQNPWQTYINLRKVVTLDRWKQTLGYLPGVRIQDFDLPDEYCKDSYDEQYEDSDNDEAEDQYRQQLLDLLKDVQDQVKDVSENGRAELSALSRALSTLSSQMEGVETATGKRIEKLASTVNILLWLAGAILLFLLLK